MINKMNKREYDKTIQCLDNSDTAQSSKVHLNIMYYHSK